MKFTVELLTRSVVGARKSDTLVVSEREAEKKRGRRKRMCKGHSSFKNWKNLSGKN